MSPPKYSAEDRERITAGIITTLSDGIPRSTTWLRNNLESMGIVASTRIITVCCQATDRITVHGTGARGRIEYTLEAFA